MKYRERILRIWIGAVVVMALAWGTALYNNIRRGYAEAKEVAVETLSWSAELVVRQDFEELGEFYASFGGKKHPKQKRKSVSAAGEFEVEVDSLKETQGLFLLDAVGSIAYLLHCYGEFPLEQIRTTWKDEMDARYNGAMCALSLEVHPLGKDSCQTSTVGDEAIIASRYDLGTYYIDSMYTMRLTAYMQLSVWRCVDWTDGALVLCSCLLGLVLLAGWLAVYAASRRPEKEEKREEATTTTYRFGECIYDSVNHTLTYRGETMACTPQLAKLLLGFAKAPDLFLSTDEINTICNWASDDLSLNDRRRRAISSLKKLFGVDKSIQIQFVREKKGYQIVIFPEIQSTDK